MKELKLSCNKLGGEAGKKLLEGVAHNDNIVRLDLRLAGCGRSVDAAVQERLRRNKFRRSDWKLIEDDDSDWAATAAESDSGGEDTPSTPGSGTPAAKSKKKAKRFFPKL